jgi:hypothetical protein
MEDKESKVTKAVREGVVKAFDIGEDIVQAIGRITKEVIRTAKDEDLSNKEKVQKLAQEALEGAKQGAKTVQPPTEKQFNRLLKNSLKKQVKL